jgi:excisionase family DNA binding protein
VSTRNPNHRLAKIHRSYTVEEVARLFGAHRNTVRAWLRAGLPALDQGRPTLIAVSALRAFLHMRR